MNYPLVQSSWQSEEAPAVHEVLESGWLTSGERVEDLEREFAKYIGSEFSLMCNSGSSANLLATSALRYSKSFEFEPGDEVIVPAVGWSTTYSPFLQYGLKLKFVDVDLATHNIDLNLVKQAINKNTKMIVAVNILGNPCQLDQLKQLCDEHSIILFEDNCESMGATLNQQACGSFGQVGTFSTFYSHHISTIEGGFIVTDNEELYRIMLSLRSHGWSRALPGEQGMPELYNFIFPGYNLRSNEISAAIGLEQLKKIENLNQMRINNAKYFQSRIEKFDWLSTQQENGQSSWFAFSLLLNSGDFERRNSLIRFLKENKIESRMVTGGNFLRHDAIRFFDYSVHAKTPNADKIHDLGLFVGNSGHDLTEQIDLLVEVLQKFEAHL